MANFNIKILQASYGDCIFISQTFDGKEFNILIDGGTKSTFIKKTSKGRLRPMPLKLLIEELKVSNKCIDLLIVTHVDDDHIGGLLTWFEEEIPSKNFMKEIWINDDVPILENNGLDNSCDNAVSLLAKMKKAGISLQNNIITGQSFDFDWGVIRVLSPTVVQHNKIAKQMTGGLDNSDNPNYNIPITELIKKEWNCGNLTNENKASIALLITTRDGENNLLLGDADVDTIINSLQNIGYNNLNPLICNWVKLPHHGSVNNFKPCFLNIIKAKKYIVSTNGLYFGHPDKEVLAQIIDKTTAKIYFNYPERAQLIFNDEDHQKYPCIKERIKSC